MTEDALTGLAQLARARTEREGLLAQLEVTQARRETVRRRLAEARSRLEDERSDVAALESMSMSRILAGLRGSRAADLDREQAEEAAAQYVVAEAEARLAVEEREVATLEARVAEHGDLDARRAELLTQREREVRDDPRSLATIARLEELAEQLGRLQTDAVQLAEADAAGRRAHETLRQAADHLGSAGSWATYDTFFGGGLVADMVKHDRLDRAGALMREADAALARLASELADVGIGSVGGLGITDMTKALDIWFDNIFSDWAVRDRIERASRRVHELLAAVAAVGEELARRRTSVAHALEAVAREREQLLVGDA